MKTKMKNVCGFKCNGGTPPQIIMRTATDFKSRPKVLRKFYVCDFLYNVKCALRVVDNGKYIR